MSINVTLSGEYEIVVYNKRYMHIEYEATFPDIDKADARSRLKKAGATLLRPEFMQKRFVFDTPDQKAVKGRFLRVRDEGDKITLTLKMIGDGGIADQKEIETEVKDFDETVLLLETIGCTPLAYEESRRELWDLDGAKVTIDEWPFIGSLVEVEGDSEDHVKAVSEKLDFKWSDARFYAIGMIYVEKYGKGPIDLTRETGTVTKLMFEGENPFRIV